MDPRAMNRRSLCKALVAFVMTALSSSPKRVVAEPGVLPASGDRRASGIQQNKRKLVVCILRRQSPSRCVTFSGSARGTRMSREKDATV